MGLRRRFQRFGDHAFAVHRHGDHVRTQEFRRAPKTGIGKLFDQHGGAPPLEQGLQDHQDRVLPAIGQHHVVGAKGPQWRRGQPSGGRRARRAPPGTGWVMHEPRGRVLRHLRHQLTDQRGLPDAGQMRGKEVHVPALRLGIVRRTVDLDRDIGQQWRFRVRSRHECASPHTCHERAVIGQDCVGPRHGAGRDPQSPGEVPHWRQLFIGLQDVGRNGVTDRLDHGLVFGSGRVLKVGLPNCIHYNVSLACQKIILYPSSHGNTAILCQYNSGDFPWHSRSSRPQPTSLT